MKNAPTVKSWKSLLKYLLDNKADKGRHESDALPGLIKAITRMQDQGEAFTADPRELWKRINSRPSDVTNENAPLRSDLEDDTVNPSRGGGAFPRRESNHFEDPIRNGGWPPVPVETSAQPEEVLAAPEAEEAPEQGKLASLVKNRRVVLSGVAAAAGIAGLAAAILRRRRAAA